VRYFPNDLGPSGQLQAAPIALRSVISPFAPPPSPLPSPFNWGDPEWLKENLGRNFAIECETAELTHRFVDAEDAWRVYVNGFSPIHVTYQALDEEKKAGMKAAFLDWVSPFGTDLGIALT
jgi:hypothetical protein